MINNWWSPGSNQSILYTKALIGGGDTERRRRGDKRVLKKISHTIKLDRSEDSKMELAREQWCFQPGMFASCIVALGKGGWEMERSRWVGE